MKRIALGLILIASPALAQPPPAPSAPDFQSQALGTELVEAIGKIVKLHAELFAAQAQIADMQKQIETLKAQLAKATGGAP